MRKYYVAVCMPLTTGGWRAHFPDVPDCSADGSTLDRAVFHAAGALADHSARLNGTAVQVLQGPRDLVTIRADRNWEASHQIDWSTAVVAMIPVHVQL